MNHNPFSYSFAIGADHRGFALKEFLKQQTFGSFNVSWHDVGAFSPERSDYPCFAIAISEHIRSGKTNFGVLLCGNGIGVSIVANRYKNIYCGLVWNPAVARSAREDDNINVLALPADYLSPDDTRAIIFAWLDARFKGGRYQERIDMIDQLK